MIESRMVRRVGGAAVVAGYFYVGPFTRLVGRPATSDCETIRDGAILAQPAGALSALAFAVVAAWLASRAESRAERVHVAVVAALGLGSFVFHATPTALYGGVDSAAVVAYAAFWVAYALRSLGRRPALTPSVVIAAAAATVVFGVLPSGAGLLVLATAVVAALASEAAVHMTGRARLDVPLVAGLILLVAGQVVFQLSRTGRPWCDPNSLLQGHAVWHVLAAISVGLFGLHLKRREA